MGYDVHFEIDAGGDHPVDVCPSLDATYNLAPMFKRALGIPLRGLDGMKCSDALPKVVNALTSMRADPEPFKALNPPNGWGDYDGALEFLDAIKMNCAAAPKASIRIT